MKLTLEIDNQIMKDGEPDITTVIIDEHASGLSEVIDICQRAILAQGFMFKGNLEIVDEAS